MAGEVLAPTESHQMMPELVPEVALDTVIDVTTPEPVPTTESARTLDVPQSHAVKLGTFLATAIIRAKERERARLWRR